MNTAQFKLPDVGEGLTEADILTWKVAAGDAVKVNQVIVEIETAKPVVELPCPTAGSVATMLAPEGATVEVGTPIIDIVAEDAAADGPRCTRCPGRFCTGVRPPDRRATRGRCRGFRCHPGRVRGSGGHEAPRATRATSCPCGAAGGRAGGARTVRSYRSPRGCGGRAAS